MKFFVALALLAAVAYAAEEVQVLRNDQDVQADKYSYSYELGNGVSAQESGALKNPESISAQGSYKFTSPEGQVFETQYVADENGYQPSGAHLPVGPEIPEAIVRSLAYLAAHPYVEKK